MTKQFFSFKEVFMFSWSKTKQHAWFIFLTLLIIHIINSARIAPFLETVVMLMTALSVMSVSLLISRDSHFTFHDLYTPLLSPKKVLKFFALTALYALPVIATFFSFAVMREGLHTNSRSIFLTGFILSFPLSLVAIYTSVRFKFFSFVVIENENASLKELILMTRNITNHKFLDVLVFLLALSVLNLIPLVLAQITMIKILVLGVFITVPISLFSLAHLYNKLRNHPSM